MTDPEQMMELFALAGELPPAERGALLARECADRPELLAELESLLELHAEAEAMGFLNEPALNEVARQTALETTQDSRTGELLGRYRILKLLGEGGMAEVYLAEDTELHRNVALKMIKGIRTEELLDHFAKERRILAHLNHESIARLLDAGTSAAGVPFLVMEYVDGTPITEHCDRKGLSIAARLELFRVVCTAVQYAHQSVVIHRDLKPSNILVTAEGQVKLLDFGIARLLDSSVSFEATGALFPALTPEYASPEQIRGEVTTTATDVYSLGVVLYESLTGSRLYELKRQTTGELLKAVCEQEPRRPSTTEASPRVAEIEGGVEKLRRRLRGDLDHIVLKALRKTPEARYPTVEQFSDDIGRHLEGLPVMARRRTFLYSATRFVRRHRTAVIAAGFLLLTLLGGVVATSWEAHVARAQRARAERRFNDVRKLANSFLFEFHDSLEKIPGTLAARQLILKRALQYLDGLAQESGDDLPLNSDLAEAYDRLGNAHLGRGRLVRGASQGSQHQPEVGGGPTSQSILSRAVVQQLHVRSGSHERPGGHRWGARQPGPRGGGDGFVGQERSGQCKVPLRLGKHL